MQFVNPILYKDGECSVLYTDDSTGCLQSAADTPRKENVYHYYGEFKHIEVRKILVSLSN